MTDAATPQQVPLAPAQVTREHRMLAIACMEGWEYGMLTPDHRAWLDGLPTAGIYDLEGTMAQAIADAEARGRAQAAVSDDQLADDLELVRGSLPKQNRMGAPSSRAALDRIAAALAERGKR